MGSFQEFNLQTEIKQQIIAKEFIRMLDFSKSEKLIVVTNFLG
jgi:hypothetical protein